MILNGGKGCRVFDHYFLPVIIKENQVQSDLPGLLVCKVPKRADRTKLEDVFIALISEQKPGSIAAEDLKYLLDRMAQTYFSSPGAITAGMRTAVDQLNTALLKFNMKQKQPILARLNLAVLRRDTLYLTHVGETMTCVLEKEKTTVYSESPASPASLGIIQGINLRFFQAKVTPGVMMIMAPGVLEDWLAELQISHPQLSIESQRRRILQHLKDSQQALIWQAKSGKGVIHLLKPRTPAASVAAPPADSEPPVMPSRPQDKGYPVGGAGEGETPEASPPPQKIPLKQGIYLSGQQVEIKGDRESPLPSVPASEPMPAQSSGLPSSADGLRPKSSLLAVDLSKVKAGLASLYRAVQRAQQWLISAMKTIFARLMPGTEDKPFGIPSSVMLFIAIAVPLAVVAVAATVYFQRGLGVEQRQYLQEANETAALALAEKDPILQRIYWEKVLQTLDEADEYGMTEQSKQMRDDVLKAIDKLDGIERVEVIPVAQNQSFDSNTDIIRIAASDTEAFLLDRSKGRVLRLYLAGNHYRLDETFECGTGTYPLISCKKDDKEEYTCEPDAIHSSMMGPPVDIVLLPVVNVLRASILTIDMNGNLMYCKPGATPVVDTLPAPNQGWQQITAISYDKDVLYVFDKGINAVYYFIGFDSYFPFEIADSYGKSQLNVTSYFTGDYVPDFSQVRDMEVNGSEMFLLKDGGYLISCIQKEVLRCSDPVAYGDIRAGSDTSPVPFNLSGEDFIQIQITQPPMPAIFLLEQSRQSIYQFTWRLNLVRQLRARGGSGYSLPNSAPSAFAVTPNHVLFVAYGNQVYYGSLP